ncbi:hypothetical protein H4R99_002980 [Coemansia sp. RSA 1722]|nr:hypothetical protein IWW45_006060 [Coemansia sp. RSA 485]KAJ2601512.1 hypothetical protein H4R99_002980 [Coemansia sp. RSA 1722]
MNNNGRKSQYLQLDGSQSGSAVNMDASGVQQEPLSPNTNAAFTRGVGFEDQYTMANAAAAGAEAGRRNTMFGTLKEAMGVKQASIEPLDMRTKARQSMGGTGGEGNVEKGTHEHIEAVDITSSRKAWVAFTWFTTFWLPSPVLSLFGRMKRPDVRMAWREKFAICVIIVFMWALLLFIIIGLGLILCPRQYVWTQDDISNLNTAKKSYMSTRGNVYDITDFIKQKNHGNSANPGRPDLMSQFAGYDTNASFPIPVRIACPDLLSSDDDPNYTMYFPVRGATEDPEAFGDNRFKHYRNSDPNSDELKDYDFYNKYFLPGMKNFKKGGVVWKMDYVESMYKDNSLFWRVIDKEVFNFQPYIDAIHYAGNTNNKYNILDERFEKILDQSGFGTADITQDWLGLNWDAQTQQRNYDCMKNLFYVGQLDNRGSVRCLFTNYMLVAFACVLMLVVLVKFLTALQFTKKPRPAPPEKFVVCQVPCYTEDEESIAKTINSLAALEYADKQKLIFLICDGNIVGSGNDKSTPRIVLDILGVDPEYDPPGRDYLAIAEGSRRHNIGKVYSGLYEFEGHVVPFMVVAKVGSPEETSRSGNRGKRDSQILLMSFFNKVHFNLPMTPLELEIYHQMRHIIGVPPRNYEYLLQVDADTEVMPDSLARLVSACTSDRRIAGICGETMLGNESKSWTTMMQVYEYFISHHMAKAFESLFGSVTCLPGCFCMYRLRTAEGKPLLIAKPVLEAYSELHVDTLHKKNLLSLGEDRYLTTLMMKHFPSFKLKFIQDAKCKTIAPEKWSVLVSQRRRWINSTIHNLAELLFLADMCGFCFFSMRFVVFLDLFGTITMPTTLMYFAYLIYVAVSGIADVGYISLILIGAIYGLQAIIFLLRREWQHIGWMLIYLCAYPLWSFVLPIYSFWHMDDFSWGNTRIVVGDGKRKIIVEDDKPFDPESIPQRRWMEYEKELASAGVLNAPPPNMNPHAGSTKEDDRLSLYSSQSGAHMSRVGSAMAFANTPGGNHQSMYGTPVMPSAVGGYDPRLSVAMANPHAIAMQQQQYQQQALSMYDNQTGRMSAAGSAMGDPRLSTAMYGTPQQQQMFAMQTMNGSNQSSPHGSGIGLHHMPQQQQLGGYMNPDAWVPPTTTSVYGGANMPSQQQMSMYMQPTSPDQMQMHMQMQQQPFSPSSGGSVPLGSVNAMPSDDQIVDSIRRILVNADLTTTTKKVIRNQLTLEYGVDLSSKKEFISKIVDQMLVGNTQ